MIFFAYTFLPIFHTFLSLVQTCLLISIDYLIYILNESLWIAHKVFMFVDILLKRRYKMKYNDNSNSINVTRKNKIIPK